MADHDLKVSREEKEKKKTERGILREINEELKAGNKCKKT